MDWVSTIYKFTTIVRMWEKGGARYNAFMRRGTVVEDLGESLPMIGRSQKQRGRSECYQSVTVGKEKNLEIFLWRLFLSDSLSLLSEGTGNGIIKTIAWSGNGRVDTRGHSERKEPFVGKIMGYNGSSISGVWTRKSGQAGKSGGASILGGRNQLLVGGGAHMAVKGLTFTLSPNLQLRTDGDDYRCVIQLNTRWQCKVAMMMRRARRCCKSKSCRAGYLTISNDLHRALFGKSESVNGETIRAVRGCLEFCRNGGNSIYLVKFQPDTIFKLMSYRFV